MEFLRSFLSRHSRGNQWCGREVSAVFSGYKMVNHRLGVSLSNSIRLKGAAWRNLTKLNKTVRTAIKLSETWKWLLQTWNEGINNTEDGKVATDGQSWRRLKRIAIVVFKNLLAWQFYKVQFCCLLCLIQCSGDMFACHDALILSFPSNFSSSIANKDA